MLNLIFPLLLHFTIFVKRMLKLIEYEPECTVVSRFDRFTTEQYWQNWAEQQIKTAELNEPHFDISYVFTLNFW